MKCTSLSSDTHTLLSRKVVQDSLTLAHNPWLAWAQEASIQLTLWFTTYGKNARSHGALQWALLSRIHIALRQRESEPNTRSLSKWKHRGWSSNKEQNPYTSETEVYLETNQRLSKSYLPDSKHVWLYLLIQSQQHVAGALKSETIDLATSFFFPKGFIHLNLRGVCAWMHTRACVHA